MTATKENASDWRSFATVLEEISRFRWWVAVVDAPARKVSRDVTEAGLWCRRTRGGQGARPVKAQRQRSVVTDGRCRNRLSLSTILFFVPGCMVSKPQGRLRALEPVSDPVYLTRTGHFALGCGRCDDVHIFRRTIVTHILMVVCSLDEVLQTWGRRLRQVTWFFLSEREGEIANSHQALCPYALPYSFQHRCAYWCYN